MATGLPLVEADDRPVTVDRRARLLLGAAGLAYTALFLRWSFRNFEGHGAFAFDLGIFDQGVWLLSRLELYVVQLVAPLGFAPWWAPGLALVAAGPLALNLISDFEYQYDVRYHYSTLILPILVVATIYGVASGPALKHGIAVRGVLAVSALCAYLWSPLHRRFPAVDRRTPPPGGRQLPPGAVPPRADAAGGARRLGAGRHPPRLHAVYDDAGVQLYERRPAPASAPSGRHVEPDVVDGGTG